MAESATEKAPSLGGEDRTDMLLRLLAEYSGKLRAICDESIRRGEQAGVLMAGGVLLAAVCAAVGVGWGMTRSDPEGFFFAFGGLVLGSAVLALAGVSFNRGRLRRRAFDQGAWVLLHQLQHLVRVASQREQHVESDFSKRLELELRLADAEGALLYAEGILGKRDLGKPTAISSEPLGESEGSTPAASRRRRGRAPVRREPPRRIQLD